MVAWWILFVLCNVMLVAFDIQEYDNHVTVIKLIASLNLKIWTCCSSVWVFNYFTQNHEYVNGNLYTPTQTPEEDSSGHLLTAHFTFGPISAVVICKHCRTWNWMSLLRPGVFNNYSTEFLKTRKFTRRASKRRCVLFAAVWREPGVMIRRVLFAAGWREPGVVCYHI